MFCSVNPARSGFRTCPDQNWIRAFQVWVDDLVFAVLASEWASEWGVGSARAPPAAASTQAPEGGWLPRGAQQQQQLEPAHRSLILATAELAAKQAGLTRRWAALKLSRRALEARRDALALRHGGGARKTRERLKLNVGGQHIDTS